MVTDTQSTVVATGYKVQERNISISALEGELEAKPTCNMHTSS